MHSKFVILDRDGVINHDSAEFIKSPEEWVAIPNSLEAIALLNKHGFQVVIATNQSGIARGLYSLETLALIHEKLKRQLSRFGGEISGIYYCPHGPNDSCLCRKPKPGLLQQIANDFKLNLNKTPMVGDALRDLQAGIALGCQPILVKTGKGSTTLADKELPPNTKVFDDLMTFANDFVKTPGF